MVTDSSGLSANTITILNPKCCVKIWDMTRTVPCITIANDLLYLYESGRDKNAAMAGTMVINLMLIS